MINEKNKILTMSWLSGLLSAEIFISPDATTDRWKQPFSAVRGSGGCPGNVTPDYICANFGFSSYFAGCSDPYCAVYMDDPPQKHTTSVVKSTMNPFWDEHFLL